MSTELNKNNRILSIDRFRGTVIFCMVIFQFIAYFDNLGVISNISSHAPDANAIYIFPNYAIADVIAPMFILAIGLTYVPSFRRRAERDGTKAAVLHFVCRNLTLIGIGVCMNGINNILNGETEPLNMVIIVLTVGVLVSGILTLILGAFKAKKAKKVCSKILQIILLVMGVAGIVITTVNFIMLCLGKTADSYGYWLVLHHIGFAGLVALPFVAISANNGTGGATRLISGISILVLFAVFHEGDLSGDLFANNMELVDVVADGGLAGGFAYGAMMLIYTFFAELYYKNKKTFLISVGVFALPVIAILVGVYMTLPAGLDTYANALSTFLPINKGSISPSYVLVSMLLSLIAFIVYDCFNFYKGKFDPLMWWGKNPILLYIIEFGFIGALTAFLGDLFGTLPVAPSIIIVLVVTVLLTTVAYLLNKKNIILKL